MEKIKNLIDQTPFSPAALAGLFGAASFLIRIPFVLRYDLFFCSDSALCYLMPFRILHGDRPVYLYGQNYEGALISYITAFFFRLFGPSISLAGAVVLLEWSVGVAIGVYLLIQGTSKFTGFVGGLVAAVGVPYTLVFTTIPMIGNPGSVLLSMLILLQVYFLLKKGGSVLRFLAFGFTVGLSWYFTRKCFPALAVAGLALACLWTPAWDLRRFRIFSWGGAFLGSALAGYSPEIYYKLAHEKFKSPNFFGLIPLHNLRNSIFVTVKCVWAYFDAQPMSRVPEALHYWLHVANQNPKPANGLDVLAAFIALLVLGSIVLSIPKHYRGRNIPLFLLASLMVINVTALCVSAKTGGDIGQRYDLYPSAIPFSLWTACLFVALFERKGRFFPGLGYILLGVFLFHSLSDQISLLESPDELREIKWAIAKTEENHLDCVLAPFSVNRIITALTNDQVAGGNLNEWGVLPNELKAFSTADRIGFVGQKEDPVENEVTFEGRTYRLAGEIRRSESFWWAPYDAVPVKKSKNTTA